MSLDSGLQDINKCYFNPGSNILSASHAILQDPECLSKWIDFLVNKKQQLSESGEKSFVENISTYSGAVSISSLDQLGDWDKKLISDLENKGFTVTFNEAVIRKLPANVSVYVKLSR